MASGRRLFIVTVVVLLTMVVPASAEFTFCNAPSTTEPPVTTPTGPLGVVDFVWACNQQDCTFSPVISAAWLARGLRDIDWFFEPEGVHVHGTTLRSVLHHYPPTFVETTYRQRVVFTFGTGDVIPVEHFVTVRTTPAAAYWAENAVQTGLSVFLEPGDAEINWVQYHWDFGDGTTNDDPVGGWARSVFCTTYDQPGQKTVTLTTYDYRQEPHTVPVIDTYTKTIFVTNKPPIADGTATVAGPTVTFDGSRSLDEVPAGHKWNPNRVSCINFTPLSNEALSHYEWDFGDGSYGSGVRTTHTYTTPGTKTAILSVSDRAGAVSRKTFTFDIADNPPVASFAFNCNGRTCQFDGNSSRDDFGTLTAWEWTVNGIRIPETSAVVSYPFAADGDFVVKLAVRDEVQSSPAVSRIASVRSAAPSPPLGFVGVAPCRVYDSRAAGSRLAHGVERVVSTSNCIPPAVAQAVALQVTVLNPSGQGSLQVYGDGTPAPSIPVVNFDPSMAPAGNDTVISTLPLNGTRIKLLPNIPTKGGTADVTVDITGYFVDTTTSRSASFVPISPCRIVDSRDPATYPGANVLYSGAPAYLKVQDHTRCGIPRDLGDGAAVALNVAALTPTTAGALSVTPSSVPPGATTTVSVNAGAAVSNGSLTLLGGRPADDLAVVFTGAVTTASSHYFVDATGYFRIPFDKNVAPQLWYRAIQPCRIADTRDSLRGENQLTGGVLAGFQVRGNCGVPSDAAAVFVNAVVVTPSGSGHLQLWPAGAARPATSIINFPQGIPALANGTIIPLGSAPALMARDLAAQATVALTGSTPGTAHIVLDVFGYFSTSTKSTAKDGE